MTTLKRIPAAQPAAPAQKGKPRRKRMLTMDDGFVFAFGFWLATLLILAPFGTCLFLLAILN